MPACKPANTPTARGHPAATLTAIDTLLLSVVCTQDVLAASSSTPLDQPSADAAAATTTAVPARAEVEVAHSAVLDLQTTPDPVADPALPEPAAQEQAVTSDVLTSALLDRGSAGITAAEPQQLAGGADDGAVSAAATTNVLDLTATGTTSGTTPELIAVNVGHRCGGQGVCWQPAPASAPAPAPQTDFSGHVLLQQPATRPRQPAM